MLKILFVFGTRPEAIKMAPLIHEVTRRPKQLEAVVCVTGQHRELLDQVLNTFDIVPDHDLDVMEDNQSPTHVTASVMSKLEPLLRTEAPDWVLAQGDTTTTMAAALASFHAGVKVGHIEAGLRTRDKAQPFPEEVNRRVISLVADMHFAPTQGAMQNLLDEGVEERSIVVTGNTVVDALKSALEQPAPATVTSFLKSVGIGNGNGNGHGHSGKKLIVVTCHRRESFGEPLAGICSALRTVAQRYRDEVHIVYPVHPNPQVQQPVRQILSDVSNLSLLSPLDYLSMAHLMNHSYLIVTDSGGLQEEAPSLGKPLLLLRQLTDRTESIDSGGAAVVGTDELAVVAAMASLLDDNDAYRNMIPALNPFGDGRAASRIVDTLLSLKILPPR